ncbi:hypothetical protein HYALB_00005753 [Hymenoscyphus albidus]|uniref:Uncharacterized protein n=1 Tax=Hymenoscyphus albidus TaxID=595503 RepID=A0A9N9LT24_9HELO|nr:hypothetical protein HYALB_00005753 [Hymenoscyphus albidus]
MKKSDSRASIAESDSATSRKSEKRASVTDVLASLKRFSSIEGTRPHSDVSRRQNPNPSGSMAERRFPVIPSNPSDHFNNRATARMTDAVLTQTRPESSGSVFTGTVPRRMKSESVASWLGTDRGAGSRRGSAGTVLTGDGRARLRNRGSAELLGQTATSKESSIHQSRPESITTTSKPYSFYPSVPPTTTAPPNEPFIHASHPSSTTITSKEPSIHPSTFSKDPTPHNSRPSTTATTIHPQPPPQARTTASKARPRSYLHAAGLSDTNELVSSRTIPKITNSSIPTAPREPPRIFSKHNNNASTNTLGKTSTRTLTKISNFITMEPDQPPAASIELTPLSAIIAQSRRDIQILRVLNAKSQEAAMAAEEATQGDSKGEGNGIIGMGRSLLKTMSSIGNMRKSNQAGDVKNARSGVVRKTQSTSQLSQGRRGVGEMEMREREPEKEVDYDKIERNLERFEDLYEAFLKLENTGGEKNEEVHLVTIGSKRGEVVRGVRQAGGIKGNKIPAREVVPVAPRVITDCGI